MHIFAKRLKETRERLKRKDNKWTQEYVADLIDVARSTYTAYENGTKQPPIDTLNKIADLFDVDINYLLGRTQIKTYDLQTTATEYVLKELVNKYNIDLTDSKNKETLEKMIKLVYEEL